MLNEKFVNVLNYFTVHKTADKNNRKTYLPQQNKKTGLTTPASSNVSTPVGSQRQKAS